MHYSKTHFVYAEEKQFDPFSTVLVVGPSLGGPLATPFSLHENADAETFLGDSPMLDAYKALQEQKVPNIILYRINGKHSTGIIINPITGVETIRLHSICAGEDMNNIVAYVFGNHIVIDETAVGGMKREYSFDRYPTVDSLVDVINQDSIFGLVGVVAEKLSDAPLKTDFESRVVVLLGQGMDDAWMCQDRWDYDWQDSDFQLMRTALETHLFEEDCIHPALGALQFNTCLLSGWFFEDDPYYLNRLEKFAVEKEEAGDMGCTMVVGVQPILEPTPELIKAKEERLILFAQKDFPHIQVVVGEGNYHVDGRFVSGAYGYAGLLGANSYYESPTNKKIEGFLGLNYEIPRKGIASLSSNGYICIVPSIRKGFVPFYATSFSSTKDLLYKPHILRTVQFLNYELQQQLGGFIGNPAQRKEQQQIQQVVRDLLESYAKKQWIRSYEHSISYGDSYRVAEINIGLIFYGEIERVNTNSTIFIARGGN